MEYLVRNGEGVWEICKAGIFFLPNKEESDVDYITAWCTRSGAFFCKNEDAIEVKTLPE